MKFIIKNREILFLLVLCSVFFCFYSHFNLLSFEPSPMFSSPDETANYFWIKTVANGNDLFYFEELNTIGNDLLHARSFNAIEGKIVPGSFLGMILIYGFLAKIFGLWIVPYLTPFFSVCGIIFFYLLVKEIFQRKEIALITAALLSFVPPWLYYSSRGMYHNVLFLSLLIMGIYWLFCVLKINYVRNFKFKILNFNLVFNFLVFRYFLYFLSGFVLGLAVITRTAEIVWVGATIIFIFALNWKKIYWPGFVLFLCGSYIAVAVLFYYNQILYGQMISAGYRAIVPQGGIGELASSGVLWQILVTPFGFNLKSILVNGFNYLYKFLLYWSLPTVVGGLLFVVLPSRVIKIDYKKRFTYFFYCLSITIYLLIFYGSWELVDRIDKSALSLGTSYLRYFLPIYIVSLPWLSVFIWQASCCLIPLKKRKIVYASAVTIMLVVCLMIPSINLTLRQTDESLIMLKNLSEARAKALLLEKMTGKDDVLVIYKQADKIFFPSRDNLITELVVNEDYEALARIARVRHVYYYTYAPPATVEFISQRDFEPRGMRITDGRKVFQNDWMYKIGISKIK